MLYDDGDVKELDASEFTVARKLAVLLETDKTKEETRLLKLHRKKVSPALVELSARSSLCAIVMTS